MSAEPELCKCGHLRASHGVDSDDRDPDEVCEELGCGCERFVPMVLVEEDAPAVGSASVFELQAKPSADTIEILETLLAEAKSGKVRGIVAVSFEVGVNRQWRTGYYGHAEALWAFEHLKHELLFGAR